MNNGKIRFQESMQPLVYSFVLYSCPSPMRRPGPLGRPKFRKFPPSPYPLPERERQLSPPLVLSTMTIGVKGPMGKERFAGQEGQQVLLQERNLGPADVTAAVPALAELIAPFDDPDPRVGLLLVGGKSLRLREAHQPRRPHALAIHGSEDA